MPAPWSVTVTATWVSSTDAETVMVDHWRELAAALEKRLCRTCAIRRLSAHTGGRLEAASMSTLWRCPLLRKARLACSMTGARSVGSGDTERVPASMRVMSSKSLIRSRMWSAWSSMRPKNWPTSAGSSGVDESRTVAAAPLIDVSGARSSWLTMARNSARSRSRSSSGVMSCSVATTDTSSPSSERIGEALTRVVTLVPSRRSITSSSACTASPSRTARTTGNSLKATSDPSMRRQVSPHTSCVASRASAGGAPTMRRASRLTITTVRELASTTNTPTGDVLTRSLEVGLGSLLIAVAAGVGDRHRRLGGEHRQGLLVVLGEHRAVVLVTHQDRSHMAVPHP